MKAFPHRFRASDTYGWADCPILAKMVWNRIRPEGFTWYAVDYELITPTSIRLFVYDIADNFHGGIGNRIHEQEIAKSNLTPAERIQLKKDILGLYDVLAAKEFIRQQEIRERDQILAIRKEMFGI